MTTPVILLGIEKRRPNNRPLVSFELTTPTKKEQRQLWVDALSGTPQALENDFDQTAKPQDGLTNLADKLVGQFDLDQSKLHAAAAAAGTITPDMAAEKNMVYWNACRAQVRPQLDNLTTRVPSDATWDTLVLPPRTTGILREISAQMHNKSRVFEEWGLGDNGGTSGSGTVVLFSGLSGTGKTLAAKVLANELNLDLYRVDLSAVVDKYIGETEKNLRRIFDAADAGGVVLLFDEADALFGKRSRVKDSHDRHANIEVSYLLQRLEEYRGLAILTSNLKAALDPAFMRRLRFVLEFPYPDQTARTAMWDGAFSTKTPTTDLDTIALGRFDLAGGQIRTAALNAAFLAANAESNVALEHVLASIKKEYTKAGKTLSDGEINAIMQP